MKFAIAAPLIPYFGINQMLSPKLVNATNNAM